MNKCIMGIIAIVLLIAVAAPVLMAEEVVNNQGYEWQVIINDYGIIQENIKIYDSDIQLNEAEWDYSESSGMIQLQRTVSNWEEYEQLSDRLPVNTSEHNYILFKTTDIKYDVTSFNKDSIFAVLLNQYPGTVIIQVPGIIRDNTAAEVKTLKQEPTAVWYLTNDGSALQQNGKSMLKFLSINGMVVALLFLLIGIIAIGIWYIRFVKKVDRIIDEEYSLENINNISDKNEANDKN